MKVPKEKNFARNWEELAQLISGRIGEEVTARAIFNWRNDPRYTDWPRPKSGRHDVRKWIEFMLRHGLKRADELVDADELPEERKKIVDWKEHREKLMCEKLEREILRDDGKLLVAIDLEIALGQLIAGICVALDYFAPSAARFVVGLRDIHDVQEKLQSEIDAVKQRLNAARFLDDCVGELVSSFPFDEETAELFKRVSFAGQDRCDFLELIRLTLNEALRRIGRRSIDQSGPTSRSEVSPIAEVQMEKAVEASPSSDPPPAKPRTVTRRRKRAGSQASKAK